MKDARGESLTAEDITILGETTFYGREKAADAFPIALANLMLHGIDNPHIWAGNTLLFAWVVFLDCLGVRGCFSKTRSPPGSVTPPPPHHKPFE